MYELSCSVAVAISYNVVAISYNVIKRLLIGAALGAVFVHTCNLLVRLTPKLACGNYLLLLRCKERVRLLNALQTNMPCVATEWQPNDPLSYFLLQLCPTTGLLTAMVCAFLSEMVYLKDPFLLIEKRVL